MTRIARFNPRYRAFSHLAANALKDADVLQRELEAGKPRRLLHALAVSVKGNIPVAGMPWTEGSAMYATRIATRDAEIVARARAAGGVVVGTTTLSELAMYGVENPFEPMGLNPWAVERTAGGSSTGAGVAAALRLAQVNIGTDSGGSIRNPACHCGVVGFMPRIGALPLEGVPNHTPSLSSLGLVALSVVDAAQAYDALAGPSPAAATAPALARRLLVPRELVGRMCDDETQALFGAALERLAVAGFGLVDAAIAGWIEGERGAGSISLHESGRALSRMDLSHASEGLRARAAAAARLGAAEIDEARSACATLRENVAAGLRAAGADAVVTPTWPFPAPGIRQQTAMVRGVAQPIDPHRNCFVRAANAMDGCAITVPMGLYAAGVPAGLHLLSEGGTEHRLLAVARLIEEALPRPPPPPPLRAYNPAKGDPPR